MNFMPFRNILVLLLLALSFFGEAQNKSLDFEIRRSQRKAISQFNCGYDQHVAWMEQKVGNYGALLSNANQQIQLAQQLAINERTNGSLVYTLPVHVIVVHKGEAIGTGTNISAAQIQSQIDVLNEDFRKLNSDLSFLPAEFDTISGDMRFEFCLATVDPSGNPSTGISRVLGVDSNYTMAEFNFFVKPSTVWDATRYLNLWSADLDGNLLGYAQFPWDLASAPNTDGVVCDYAIFGYNTSPPFNLGRTMTHEVGHWMGLLHVWGDDAGACNGSDFVDDTPNQGGSTAGCPSYPQTSCTSSDMYFNFMDYSYDACSIAYTEGQVSRAHAAMKTFRNNILTAANGICAAPVAAIANFNYDALVPFCESGNIAFNDLSTGFPTEWSWTFSVVSGDVQLGVNTADSQFPVLPIYGGSGTIQANLTAINDFGSNSSSQSIAVVIDTLCGGACPPCPTCGTEVSVPRTLTSCDESSIVLTATIGNSIVQNRSNLSQLSNSLLGSNSQASCSNGGSPWVWDYTFPSFYELFDSATVVNLSGIGAIDSLCIRLTGVTDQNLMYVDLEHDNSDGLGGVDYETVWIGADLTFGGVSGLGVDADNNNNCIDLCFYPGVVNGEFDGVFDGEDGNGTNGAIGSFIGADVAGPWSLWVADFSCYAGSTTVPSVSLSAQLYIQDEFGGSACVFVGWVDSLGQLISTNNPYTLNTGSVAASENIFAEVDCGNYICSDDLTLNTIICCKDSLYVGGIIMDDFYNADSIIVSNGQVPASGNVIMKAGVEVLLNSDFEVDQNANYEADIENCPP